ncbi:response regulator, partial [Achromobacter xylosoxidans]
VYGFAQQSGGSARIVSAPGQGTKITLCLPRHAAADGAEPEEDVAGAQASPPAPAPGTDRPAPVLLLVEDEPAMRCTVAEFLRDRGWRVLEAEDGASALEALQGGPAPDLLLTDVGLPGGMNGRQVADAGRALHPRLPVLFIT